MNQSNHDNAWIHMMLREIVAVTSESERLPMLERYRNAHPDETDQLIIQDADVLSETLLRFKSYSNAANHRLASLTDAEREEMQETERILNENQFEYYFQPIVNTADGEIFSYEALMRPKSHLNLSPLHILKYAGLLGRLSDIERDTFLNVLELIDTRKDEFLGRFVFINSIPDANPNVDDFRSITRMLLKHADTAVVEMTEQSELNDEKLENIKERYRNMGIKMAIDDYGTGYSNVGNLLRYMPHFVKIDRSLLNNIQTSPKKRHFVREIIQFCHDNSILALAEGIETAEELRTVIQLGADLVQGFFTARPSPQIISSIPEEIRQLIRRFRQERENGIDQQLYLADSSERILLDRLIQSNIRRIIIGTNGNGNVIVEGNPDLDSQIRIETCKGFCGKITLENTWIGSIKNKPCIDIGEDNDAVLILTGDNKLDHGGIRVPESARLTIAGEGRMEINVHSDDYYGIGNGQGFLHGELVFAQSGRITVNGKGQSGIAIGSGNGGSVQIGAGQYRLNLQGDVAVGIGALYSESELMIHDCDIGMEITAARGTAIGSIGRNNTTSIFKASVKIFMSGIELVGIGTLDGKKMKYEINEASCILNIKGERCAGLAALEGCTDVTVHQAGIKIAVKGSQALGIGGFTADTVIRLNDGETLVSLDTPIHIADYLTRGNVIYNAGQFSLMCNGACIMESGTP